MTTNIYLCQKAKHRRLHVLFLSIGSFWKVEKELFIHKVTIKDFTAENQWVPSIGSLSLTLSWLTAREVWPWGFWECVQSFGLLSHIYVRVATEERVSNRKWESWNRRYFFSLGSQAGLSQLIKCLNHGPV